MWQRCNVIDIAKKEMIEIKTKGLQHNRVTVYLVSNEVKTHFVLQRHSKELYLLDEYALNYTKDILRKRESFKHTALRMACPPSEAA